MSGTDAAPEMVALAAAVLHAAREPERVLEIGCGDGERTLFLAREFPRARIRGVDRSLATVQANAARIGLDPEGRVAFKVGRAGSLPFPDDHFDLIAHGGTAATAEIARVLRTGGDLISFSASRPRGPLGLRERRVARSLSRHRFEPLHSGGAGGGSYLVARLRSAR